MEGVSNGTSCMMAFGENSNNGLVCPMMMMPLITTTTTASHHNHNHNHHHHHHHQQNPNPGSISETANMLGSVFLPLPLTASKNPSANAGSSLFNMLDSSHHHGNNTNTYNFHNHMADHDHGHNHEHHQISNAATTDGTHSAVSSFKAKIMAHPHYHRLLASYVNCQKVGAPPEVVARLEAACSSAVTMGHVSGGCLGEDPALDQFMEAYCEMLSKYEQELSKPFKEAMLFLQRIESQFKSLTVSSPDSACGEAVDRNGSSEEEVDVNNSLIDPQAEDRELKGQLLRKYSGYLGSLKQEFMKKRKKGKLPKEARQQLLDWWSRHYKWPYPSESQKVALAESTGLDQKQINNWFINQRKRHWKPSEDMQLVVMDAANPHHYYMETVLGNPFPMDLSPHLL